MNELFFIAGSVAFGILSYEACKKEWYPMAFGWWLLSMILIGGAFGNECL